jgi:nitrite reductase (NO-forming)
MALGLAALCVAIIGIFLPVNDSGSTNGAPGAVAPGPEVPSAAKVAFGAKPTTMLVSLGDLFVKPNKLSADAGEHVVLNVRNSGKLDHDLQFANGLKTKMLKAGQSETLDLGVVTTSLTAFCTVAGHKDAGMTLALNVVGGTPVVQVAAKSAEAAAVTATHADASPASVEAANATIDFNAAPPAGWKPRDPVLAPALTGTVHEITFRATEKVIEVSPGVTQEMWTFNDTVPGPVLHGKIGDTFKITLINEGKLGHSIDFHASRVAWNDEMRTILPGESLVYEFTANYAGAFMYHCGTAPALHHIGNGMFGAIIIDPPDLAPVDHEYLIVQSELYLGPQGQPGSLAKMSAENFDAVVFNGYVKGYFHAPIRVEPNERIRVWVVDDGPSENSAFHIVGTIFDTVWKEGTYLLRPDARQGGTQVLDLQPAQGGFVEFSFAEKGLYPIVTHKFSNVGKGALGLFQAGEVAPTGEGH